MKKYLLPSIAFIATTLVSVNASASSIRYETRSINHGVNSANYAASWAAQTSTISSSLISNFNGTQPGYNSFAHLKVDFDVSGPNSGTWSFQIAPDAGYGGAIYLDGILADRKAYDLWWGYNWNASSQIFTGLGLPVSAGHHVFEGFWAENCCSGGQGGRFNINNGTWQPLTTSNLDAANVPAPGSLWLFGSGLLISIAARVRSVGSRRA